ncbi:hypothetical protein VOLCADRAFT_100446 [Volvox carteri f. nagariensis]|uniref:WSC domain-containing protein n=1 Tax=Volvox carteri f. nagariensis TaxID=3068 RepID=D8UK83_VOLCA|nr:uncharacterized protein VOLCADRAFT_100446 [Volvox carteri f. nagariensis]EFJ39867.1 hypothetical protein VOLCADRAFT_100446 [Volvox carteri f. nagariensis]|eukprot:XP_002959073.1 hypothetical protein VOLCADRAFT_100446 [Volvox carteri f. nagariensis]
MVPTSQRHSLHLLGVVLVISISGSSAARSIKQLGSPFLGCYNDYQNDGLPYNFEISLTNMTVDRCSRIAQLNGIPFFGLKAGRGCYAGYDIQRVLSNGYSDQCTSPCTGNQGQICGGEWALSLYATPPLPRPSPPPPYISSGCFVGCFRDRVDMRTLPNMYVESPDMTVDRCRQLARSQGHPYFGVEAGTQCFAGYDLYMAYYVNGRGAACDWQCGGDASQICGGDLAISVYHTIEPRPPPRPPAPPPSLRKSDLLGCYRDSETFRALPYRLSVSENMTVAECQSAAKLQGYSLYGLEAGRECWAGYDSYRATSLGPSISCDWPCTGDDCEMCGGDWAILVFSVTAEMDQQSSPPPFRPYSPHWPAWPQEVPSYPPIAPPMGPASPPWAVVYEPRWPNVPPPSPPPPPPPVYGTQPPNAAADAFVLPEGKRPEVAYFDAKVGVSAYTDAVYEDIVLQWKDVFLSERPDNQLYFLGECHTAPATPSSSPAIRFDGWSCWARMADPLPNWDSSETGAFTAVWIGRFTAHDYYGFGYSEQAYATLSRTENDFDRELSWTSQRIMVYSHANGMAADIYTATPPSEQWTMQVLSRSPDGNGGVTISYFWYGISGYLNKWSLHAGASSIDPDNFALGADSRDSDKFFSGDVAVVMLYNRTLSEGAVRGLIDFYSPRFGWPNPNA